MPTKCWKEGLLLIDPRGCQFQNNKNPFYYGKLAGGMCQISRSLSGLVLITNVCIFTYFPVFFKHHESLFHFRIFYRGVNSLDSQTVKTSIICSIASIKSFVEFCHRILILSQIFLARFLLYFPHFLFFLSLSLSLSFCPVLKNILQ